MHGKREVVANLTQHVYLIRMKLFGTCTKNYVLAINIYDQLHHKEYYQEYTQNIIPKYNIKDIAKTIHACIENSMKHISKQDMRLQFNIQEYNGWCYLTLGNNNQLPTFAVRPLLRSKNCSSNQWKNSQPITHFNNTNNNSCNNNEQYINHRISTNFRRKRKKKRAKHKKHMRHHTRTYKQKRKKVINEKTRNTFCGIPRNSNNRNSDFSNYNDYHKQEYEELYEEVNKCYPSSTVASLSEIQSFVIVDDTVLHPPMRRRYSSGSSCGSSLYGKCGEKMRYSFLNTSETEIYADPNVDSGSISINNQPERLKYISDSSFTTYCHTSKTNSFIGENDGCKDEKQKSTNGFSSNVMIGFSPSLLISKSDENNGCIRKSKKVVRFDLPDITADIVNHNALPVSKTTMIAAISLPEMERGKDQSSLSPVLYKSRKSIMNEALESQHPPLHRRHSTENSCVSSLYGKYSRRSGGNSYLSISESKTDIYSDPTAAIVDYGSFSVNNGNGRVWRSDSNFSSFTTYCHTGRFESKTNSFIGENDECEQQNSRCLWQERTSESDDDTFGISPALLHSKSDENSFGCGRKSKKVVRFDISTDFPNRFYKRKVNKIAIL